MSRNLEIIADHLLDHARFWLIEQGHDDLPALILAVYAPGADDPEVFPLVARGDADKEVWARFAQFAIALLEAECYAVSFSAWMVRRPHPEGPVPRTYDEAGVRPSQAPDRAEVVFVTARSAEDGRAVRLADMIRGADGKVTELRRDDKPGGQAKGLWDGLFDIHPVIKRTVDEALAVLSRREDRIAIVQGFYDRALAEIDARAKQRS